LNAAHYTFCKEYDKSEYHIFFYDDKTNSESESLCLNHQPPLEREKAYWCHRLPHDLVLSRAAEGKITNKQYPEKEADICNGCTESLLNIYGFYG